MSRGPIENVSAQEIGVSPVVPMIVPPVFEAPDMEASVIRTESYINTIHAAVQQQETAKAAQLQAMHQQAMMQAQM